MSYSTKETLSFTIDPLQELKISYYKKETLSCTAYPQGFRFSLGKFHVGSFPHIDLT